jgi:hypothetical protein
VIELRHVAEVFAHKNCSRGKLKKIGFVTCVFIAALSCARGTGLIWPTNQFLPTFSPPPATIQYIDMSGDTAAQVNLFVSLEGIVNREQSRIACVYGSLQEGKLTWLNLHHLTYSAVNGFTAIQLYQTNITGLVVTDTNQPDTLNLATTIAGVNNELICDPSLLPTLTNAPYNLAINDDLRGKFSNKYQVYQYLYSNYWAQCTHRIIAGMETNAAGDLRDYLIAVKSAVVWLDPGVANDAATLAPFLAGMTPVGGVYMGWWPNEANGLSWIAGYGIPVVASDFFLNGSLFSGVAQAITVPAIPPAPPLQNKVYVSVILSDGDNVQYMQHRMTTNWADPARGSVPIGWTVQPLAADLDPGMLNYFWSTATTNDCLVAGPSGAGYTRLNYWSPANIAAYTAASNPYLQRSGITGITVWLTISKFMANSFAGNCPTLLGLFDQDDGIYTTNYETIPTIGLPGDDNYTSTAALLITGITNAATNWNGSSPMFIAVQGSGWDIGPIDCKTIASSLDTNKYMLVRPDHLFQLYRQASGLAQSGAPKIYGNLPGAAQVPAGFPLNLTVYPLGSAPMSYQWFFNGTNLADNVRVNGSQTGSLTISPAFPGDVGQYQMVVSNSLGSATSAVCSVTVGRASLSNAAGWFTNGHPATIANGSLKLTDGSGSEVSSAFLNCPQYIGAFTASYTYQDVGSGGADGCAFVLQNAPNGAAALGGGGGGLGYSAVTPSVAVEFNIYSANTVGMAVRPNGATGTPYGGTGSVNLAGGHPIGVTISYNGTVLSTTLTDAVSHVSFVTNTSLNIPSVLGTNTAYVGLTGADGGTASTQVVSNFQFASEVTLSGVPAGTNAVALSWPNSAGGLVLQQAQSVVSPWASATNTAVVNSNGMNQAVFQPQNANSFYRLATP